MASRVRRRVLPGFGLTLGVTIVYLSLLVLIPLSALFLRAASLDADEFFAAVASPRALAAYKLSFGASALAAGANAVFGLVVAWVLVRYPFRGRDLVDALVDLPFALPTAVAGITLTALLAKNGWVGRWLEPLGIEAAYTPLGVTLALTFIGLPFVVRTLQPVLEDLDREIEEAAASLGRAGSRPSGACSCPPSGPPWSPAPRSPSRARWASTARSCSSPGTCRCAPRSRRS
jgi:sulfate transport system permease protein